MVYSGWVSVGVLVCVYVCLCVCLHSQAYTTVPRRCLQAKDHGMNTMSFGQLLVGFFVWLGGCRPGMYETDLTHHRSVVGEGV